MQIRIVAISGSLRAGSLNTVLLRAASAIAPTGMSLELYDEIDRLPFFNPDLATATKSRPPSRAFAPSCAVRTAC